MCLDDGRGGVRFSEQAHKRERSNFTQQDLCESAVVTFGQCVYTIIYLDTALIKQTILHPFEADGTRSEMFAANPNEPLWEQSVNETDDALLDIDYMRWVLERQLLGITRDMRTIMNVPNEGITDESAETDDPNVGVLVEKRGEKNPQDDTIARRWEPVIATLVDERGYMPPNVVRMTNIRLLRIVQIQRHVYVSHAMIGIMRYYDSVMVPEQRGIFENLVATLLRGGQQSNETRRVGAAFMRWFREMMERMMEETELVVD
jgi:hypothetical protein